MQQENTRKQTDPMLSFHLMKFAFQDYQKNICHLTNNEYSHAYQSANEEMLLHQVILSSDEACCVVIPEALLRETLHGVIREYPSREHFFATLQENDIPLPDYRIALHNDLRVETTLARVACTVQSVTPSEMLHYFSSNKTEFHQPERRSASLIQIRCDLDSPVERTAAIQQITRIHSRVCKNPSSFNEEARIFSDCSTHAHDGHLGKLAAGELCHALDKTLFSLARGEISPVIENSNGLNVLYCHKIHPEKLINFNEASSAIFAILLKKKQLNACRIWLQELVQPQT